MKANLKTTFTFVSLFILFFGNGTAIAETHIVSQQNKAFDTSSLTIKKGDSVDFLNKDSFFHNVFSLSDAKLFDLGSYPQGESRSIVFDESGEVEVECAIHPDMFMTIIVKD